MGHEFDQTVSVYVDKCVHVDKSNAGVYGALITVQVAGCRHSNSVALHLRSIADSTCYPSRYLRMLVKAASQLRPCNVCRTVAVCIANS